MAKKRNQTQIVADIKRNENNYNLLENIYDSAWNFKYDNTLSEMLKEEEAELLQHLEAANKIILKIQDYLQAWTEKDYQELKTLIK